ncbi:MAG: diaminopimelate decarboxylase [Rickettsiales bacterium]|nr:diaminopimelate decarboxylase [Rickettsiales bacterium]
MDHFAYKDGVMHAEDVALPALAEAVQTPFYCYSTATLERHFNVFREGLGIDDALICFAVKANSNLNILKTLGNAGSGADVVSEGEIRQSLAAGIPANRIVFSGVGKTRSEMAYALQERIFQFNIESEPELEALNEVALSLNVKAPIAVRVNPDVLAETHAKISTGHKESKFGIAIDQASEFYRKASELKGIKVQGVSMHIGSQLTSLEPFRKAYLKVRVLVESLRNQGHDITTLDLGGGLGIPYDKSAGDPPSPAEYGKIVRETVGDLGCRLVFEPGRLLVGNAGILVTRVIYVKRTATRIYVIVDAAMNDLLRPSLYEAYHDIVPVQEPGEKAFVTPVDIVGPVCETGDTFAEQRSIALPKAGELLAFRSAGAYGAVMASSYNSRLASPEVMVRGDQYAIIRPRPDYDALLKRDVIADWF